VIREMARSPLGWSLGELELIIKAFKRDGGDKISLSSLGLE
jgi:hypothetical protein